MSNMPNNPPAFPYLREHTEQNKNEADGAPWTWYVGEEGMSLRDYFAAAALTGLLANPNRVFYDHTDAATEALGVADAMLRRRNF